MPVHLASAALSRLLGIDAVATTCAALLAVATVRSWAQGKRLLESLDEHGGRDGARDLHGRVVVVVGGLSAQGLLVCSYLSTLGAQLVLLVPDAELYSPRVVQLVDLLRAGTQNELIYAEACDVLDLHSVTRFASRWNEGEGHASADGGLGAGPATGGQTSGLGKAGSPRRLDALVFLPLDEAAYRRGESALRTRQGLELGHAEVLGRFHLVNALLPSLLLLPPERDVRIVSLVSPWYAAGLGCFDVDDLDWEHELGGSKATTSSTAVGGRRRRRFPSHAPWTAQGSATLLWLLLSYEVQRRLQLLADADPRPRTKLAGIDPGAGSGSAATTAASATAKATWAGAGPSTRARVPSNISVVNVCAGFERNRDVLQHLLPARARRAREARLAAMQFGDEAGADEGGAGGASEMESKEKRTGTAARPKLSPSPPPTPPPTTQPPSEELKKLLDPRLRQRARGGKDNGVPSQADRGDPTQRAAEAALRDAKVGASDAALSPVGGRASAWLSSAMGAVRIALVVLLWPLVWLVAKSPANAARTAVWAVTAPLETRRGFEGADPTTAAAAAAAQADLNRRQGDEARAAAAGANGGQSTTTAATAASRTGKTQRIRAGYLYREGEMIRPPLPPHLVQPEALAQLWAREEALVERLVGGLRRPQGERSAATTTVQPASR